MKCYAQHFTELFINVKARDILFSYLPQNSYPKFKIFYKATSIQNQSS